jgi:hypothetical protein
MMLTRLIFARGGHGPTSNGIEGTIDHDVRRVAKTAIVPGRVDCSRNSRIVFSSGVRSPARKPAWPLPDEKLDALVADGVLRR